MAMNAVMCLLMTLFHLNHSGTVTANIQENLVHEKWAKLATKASAIVTAKVTAKAEIVKINKLVATFRDNVVTLPDSSSFSAGTSYVLETKNIAKAPGDSKRFILVIPGPVAATDAPSFEVGQEYMLFLHQDLPNDLKVERLMLYFKTKCEKLSPEQIFLAIDDRDAVTSVTRENRAEIKRLMDRLRSKK